MSSMSAFSQKGVINIPHNSVTLSMGLYRDFPQEDYIANNDILYFDLGFRYSYRSDLTPIGFSLGLDFHSIDNLGGIVDITIMPNLHYDIWSNRISFYLGAGGILARASSPNWRTYLWGYALSLDGKYNVNKFFSAGIELRYHHYIRDIKSVPFIANLSFSLNF